MNPLFYQYITEEVFKKMLREKVKTGAQEEAGSSKVEYELTFEEQNTINYTGVKQLHTKVVTKEDYVQTLLLLQLDLATGLECTK